MTDTADWRGRVGDIWAREYRRTDRSFTGLTDRLLGRASARPFSHGLDIGCGAGETVLALGRGHPGARFLGIDVSEPLIAEARRRGAHLANVAFEVADAADWSPSSFRPDLLVSRHGVMFFADPVAAFAHLHALAADDARLVFSCFRDRAANRWATDVAALLPSQVAQTVPADAPGPFAFADPAFVRAILARAGWRDIGFEETDYALVAGSGEDPVADAIEYFHAIGPAARAASALDAGAAAGFRERLLRYLEASRQGSLVALGASAWIVTAGKR